LPIQRSGCDQQLFITGGWRQRKQIDPALLHFFFDHWMFKWLPKKFRIEAEEINEDKKAKEASGNYVTSVSLFDN